MADVFISYKRERRPAARHLEQILVRYGYSVWFDLALVRGADYEEQIQRELYAAKAVIVLWCGHSVNSSGVRSEASRAKALGKLIPVVIEPCELPLFSTLDQNIDFTAASGSPRDHALDPILDDLARLVGRAPVADLKQLREYEATWRTITGGLSLAKLPLEQVAVSETEVPVATVPSSPAPAHDYGFWSAEWEKHGTSDNVTALKAIAEHAPPYFSSQAHARIAEMEAEQGRQAAAITQRTRITEFRARLEAAKESVAKKVTDHVTAELKQAGERARAEAEARAAEERYGADGRIKVDAAVFSPRDSEAAKAGWFKPGAGKTESFKDHDIAPEMVVVPGDPAFAIGRFALTFAEWDAAQLHPEWKRHAKIEPRKPDDHGWGRGKQPVIDVIWDDAQAYCRWLSAITGKTYRLPTEAEWEHACRAGSKTQYWWGDQISPDQANYGRSEKRTVPVDSFDANPWGLYQVHGNVWEWCEDTYDASSRVLRGGSWFIRSDVLRASLRVALPPAFRSGDVGFRLARTL